MHKILQLEFIRKERSLNERKELFFRRSDDTVAGVSLDVAASIPLENALPYRHPPSYPKQKNLPGLYWFETMGRHIIYESLLEMRILQLLDFDPYVVAVAAQPFALVLPSNEKPRHHIPDFFVRLESRAGRVVEVKPKSRIHKPKFKRLFRAASEVCAQAGWGYEVATEPDPALATNVAWLAGFRRKPELTEEFVESLLDAVGEGAAMDEVLRGFDHRALVRPVLFHLLWTHTLSANLASPLTGSTIVYPEKGKSDGR